MKKPGAAPAGTGWRTLFSFRDTSLRDMGLR